jgi:1,4-alpha-glucan branching enzyme
MKIVKHKKAKKVTFSLLAPEANRVSVAGEFNDWNPSNHPMKKDKKGLWKVSVSLSPATYQYRFFVDGVWENDPTCACLTENPFGTLNCVVVVE